MVRRALVVSAVLALVVIPTATRAPASSRVAAVPVRVTPASGYRNTTFVLGFRVAERTGRYGSSQRHDVVTASAPASARGCISTLAVRAPDADAGTYVRVTLAPRRLGGRWCTGVYHGRIEELQSPVCPRGAMCPDYILVRDVVGRFALKIKGPSPAGTDTTPPSFTGLKAAFACTPGPQRPGQTTPFTLSWQAASDDVTPSSQIVYEVYVAGTPGAEDFSRPTWTTPAGVTSYRTPGLASHGTFYFVVRARDSTGNQDRNTVERRGVDPCY